MNQPPPAPNPFRDCDEPWLCQRWDFIQTRLNKLRLFTNSSYAAPTLDARLLRCLKVTVDLVRKINRTISAFEDQLRLCLKYDLLSDFDHKDEEWFVLDRTYDLRQELRRRIWFILPIYSLAHRQSKLIALSLPQSSAVTEFTKVIGSQCSRPFAHRLSLSQCIWWHSRRLPDFSLNFAPLCFPPTLIPNTNYSQYRGGIG